jgi:hypothetical protein
VKTTATHELTGSPEDIFSALRQIEENAMMAGDSDNDEIQMQGFLFAVLQHVRYIRQQFLPVVAPSSSTGAAS